MENPENLDLVETLVSRVLVIEDVTHGTAQSPFLLRFRGRLRLDSESAYDRLAESLISYNLTPLFRWDEKRHAILLIPGLPKPKPSNPVVNLALAVLTLFSVLLTGASYGMREPLPGDPIQAILAIILNGWPFAVSMLAILGGHEFGHYLMGRFHKVHVTLPYFIPLPFSPFGTMGAFINMKEPAKNRKVLLDIGIAGPLAGLIIALPVLLIGLSLSEVRPFEFSPGGSLEGNSILYLLSKFLIFGQLLPSPASYQGIDPLIYWIRYFFTSYPLPTGGMDVYLGPIAWAGWAGLLVTAMNLIPAGQLDGGHMMYVLLGKVKALRLLPLILLVLAILGLFWSGWWLWAAIIFMLGRSYAEPLDQITPLDNRRKALAVLALILFAITFSPVPLTLLG